jgi:hypothetical protein
MVQIDRFKDLDTPLFRRLALIDAKCRHTLRGLSNPMSTTVRLGGAPIEGRVGDPHGHSLSDAVEPVIETGVDNQSNYIW